MKLTVASPGNATKFKIGKTKIECDEGGTLTNKAGTYSGFDTLRPGLVQGQADDEEQRGRLRLQDQVEARGRGRRRQRLWSGRLKLSTKVFDGREQIDSCRLSTAWTAS